MQIVEQVRDLMMPVAERHDHRHSLRGDALPGLEPSANPKSGVLLPDAVQTQRLVEVHRVRTRQVR